MSCIKACLFFLCTCLTVVHAESVEFLSLSDIHIKTVKNRMVINPKGANDANNLDEVTFNELMEMMQNELGNTLKNVQFVLFNGDLGGHTASEKARINYLKAGFAGLYNQLTASFNLPVFFVFGNNDSTVAHYGPYTSQVGDLALQSNWVNAFLSSGTLCARSPIIYPCIIEYDSDRDKGNYTAWLAPSLKLIGMNTIPFLEKTSIENRQGDEASMEWLSQKLQETKPSENVLLAMHVGPSGSWASKPKDYRTRFKNILAQYPGKVIGILSGHSHFANITAYVIKSSKQDWIIPIITTSALATVYGNAPAFNHLIMDRKDVNSPWAIKDLSTYSWLQKTNNDPLVLRKYYDFGNTYCPQQVNLTLAQCLKDNMQKGSLKKSFKDGVLSRKSSGNPNFS